jgi:two-component system, LytTR family, response regulator
MSISVYRAGRCQHPLTKAYRPNNAITYLILIDAMNHAFKLIQAVDKLRKGDEQRISSEDLQAIVNTIQNSILPIPHIALPTVEGYEFVKIENINYARADSNYTHIYLISGKTLILSRTLKEVESMLAGHRFVRIHQSYFINLSHIARYVKGAGGYVIMENGDTLNVSRGHRGRLLELIRS